MLSCIFFAGFLLIVISSKTDAAHYPGDITTPPFRGRVVHLTNGMPFYSNSAIPIFWMPYQILQRLYQPFFLPVMKPRM